MNAATVLPWRLPPLSAPNRKSCARASALPDESESGSEHQMARLVRNDCRCFCEMIAAAYGQNRRGADCLYRMPDETEKRSETVICLLLPGGVHCATGKRSETVICLLFPGGVHCAVGKRSEIVICPLFSGGVHCAVGKRSEIVICPLFPGGDHCAAGKRSETVISSASAREAHLPDRPFRRSDQAPPLPCR